MTPSGSAAIAPSIVEDLLADRTPVLRRTLRGMPDEMLAALVRGVDRHADELRPGRLFRGRDGGGCAVGVMLRELDPAAYQTGRLRFWLLHGWRRRSRTYRGELGRNPRLRHLEWIFDMAIDRLRLAGAPRGAAAAAVGAWVRSEAEYERQWRSLQRAPVRGEGGGSPPGARADLKRRSPSWT